MAIIKTLDILLRGKTDKLGSDLKRAKQQISGFAGSVKSAFGGMLGKLSAIGGTVAGYLTVSKAVAKVNEQFEKLDALAKSGDKLGATVAEMQSLSLAAELAGASMGTVETATAKFSQLLGKAIGGNEQAANTFAQLGLSINSFDGLSATESLGVVFDKINSLGSQSEKTAAAMSIFGEAGSRMFALIESGSAGIQSATADIEAFGGSLTRIDAAQVEMANDAWTRLQTLLDVVSQKIAVTLAPAFTALTEMMIEAASKGGGIGTAISGSFEMVLTGIEFVNRGWHAMQGLITLTQTLAVDLFAEILGGLAKVESGLIAIGGSSFDFGLANLADAAEQVAFELGEKTRKEFGLAFGDNNFGDEFRARLDEIQKRAEVVSNDLDKKVFAKPKIDFSGAFETAKGALQGFGASLLNVGSGLIGSGASADSKSSERQTVAAVTRFSAEAQSAINSTNTPAAAINKTHKEAQKSRRNQEEALREIGRTLAGGVGVLVKLGGA